MSSPIGPDEDEVDDEVEFVSEGLQRPVLECIDLSSDSENEASSSMATTLDDEETRHKAQVQASLDKLSQKVAQERKERAEKCRAFKEKQNLQVAHGMRELAYHPTNEASLEAKRCVQMWLKMPGPKPGVVNGFFGRRRRPAVIPSDNFEKHICPVINCGRIYDNIPLLGGHLKRFDHSPCDPTISLKGSSCEFFACVACGEYFVTTDAWSNHLEYKLSSDCHDGHSPDQTHLKIVCFACPACYHLFNLRDACLQHMSAQKHFIESLPMSDTRGTVVPVPIPQQAKDQLISLCNDVPFKVRCSSCHKIITSHQEAQAHFNVHCRTACAVAKADKTVVEVMQRLQVRGQCSLCYKIFFSEGEIERHKESTQHSVEVNGTMAKALLQYSRHNEIKGIRSTSKEYVNFTELKSFFQERKEKIDCGGSPAKRKRFCPSAEAHSSKKLSTAWFCECGLQFLNEDRANHHLMTVNQIALQCGVCGKLMGEISVTRLHMSRFHGGAHLSNFFFKCCDCNVREQRYEDILSHVVEAHSGHTFFTEQEVPEELITVLDAKPSTSSDVPWNSSSSSSASEVQQNTVETSSSEVKQSWMCRMCEDVFDSEAVVEKHCGDVSSHSFQRFMCGHCPQKFFKESTVRRHCLNEHDGEIKSFYFCGFCDSMQFDSEEEFLEHYKSLHSRDYYCMDDDGDVVQPAASQSTSQPTCLCMDPEKATDQMKSTYTQCMRDLAAEGKCQYVCSSCGVSVPSYAQIKTHIHTKHAALKTEKIFDVECKTCQETFPSVPSFHKHYHSQHCTLEPCASSRTCRKDKEAEATTEAAPSVVQIKPDKNEIDDETMSKFISGINYSEEHDDDSDAELKQALTLSAEEANKESAELQEALQRSLLDF